MKVLKKVDLKISNIKNTITIYFGIPDSSEELEKMFKLRFKIYSQKNYIESHKYTDQQEKDEYDTNNKCIYFIAKIDNHIVGSVRVIHDNPLPTEKYYKFDKPDLSHLAANQKCEIGRLVIDKYNPVEYTYLPQGIVMFFLISCIVDYTSKNNINTALAFIKTSLKNKMKKRKMPFHIIQYSDFQINENDVLYKYFSQKKDPVVPVWFHLKDFKVYINKLLNNKIIFKKIDDNHYYLKNNLITNFIFKRSRSKLDSQFWKKYFTVYDTLNNLIPYQNLIQTIIKHAQPNPEDKILDAGSGTGNLAVKIEKGGAVVYGIDISKEGVEMHKSKKPKGEVIVGSITDPLPFPDNYFDKIVSNNVLYTIPRFKREFVYKELYRVLKPGGVIVISNIKKGFKPVKIYSDHIKESIKSYGYIYTIKQIIKFIIPTLKIFYYNFLIKKENKSGGYDFFEPEEQKKYLEKAGFVDISPDIPTYSNQAILNYARKTN